MYNISLYPYKEGWFSRTIEKRILWIERGAQGSFSSFLSLRLPFVMWTAQSSISLWGHFYDSELSLFPEDIWLPPSVLAPEFNRPSFPGELSFEGLCSYSSIFLYMLSLQPFHLLSQPSLSLMIFLWVCGSLHANNHFGKTYLLNISEIIKCCRPLCCRSSSNFHSGEGTSWLAL